ncbi:aspartate 1-decarboxylase [Rhabdochromatium marinum]|uniref:aspartate 1-decarboxylase n=1 Tax=Rhabdochromatium marinum TaxID=48729 RepID=UPI001902DEBD|nr:aspartate 1-decarboxylase [Rhabdochromatium marinum]MBK1649570.1 aspartate 1-decarboxylase [Rhabdochromatium marinum]
MQLTMLKSKLHRARVTHAELEYEGSCAIDAKLMELGGILEFEQLHIYNLANGERFSTYAIPAEPGSRIISVNGAAAHKAAPDDRLIICTYIALTEVEARMHQPKLVYCNARNEVTGTGHKITAQAA